MKYEEIVSLVKKTDNLVCAEGITLCMWYLNEREEFDSMVRYVYEHKVREDYGVKGLYEYENNLLNEIASCSHKESVEILSKHREIWLTLIQRSELSCRYFTSDYDELFRRITPLGRKEVTIPLNSYNFIPQELLEEYKGDPMIELGGHKVLSYVIHWKIELESRYRTVDELFYRRIATYTNDVLVWNIPKKQLQQLITLFKKYFLPTLKTDSIVNVLFGKKIGNIVWIKSTEALVYFFTSLVKAKYLQTESWGIVLTRSLMFCSKKGNIITSKNINSSICRIRKKDFTLKERKAIDMLLGRFELIKS